MPTRKPKLQPRQIPSLGKVADGIRLLYEHARHGEFTEKELMQIRLSIIDVQSACHVLDHECQARIEEWRGKTLG